MEQTNILIAGGSGLIGRRLSRLLTEKGYTVRLLTRKPKAENQFYWNPESGEIDKSALEGIHAVINLAGAGIADGRWTTRRKQTIIQSRVQSARVLFDQISLMPEQQRPEVYLSASAVGYYGNSGEALMQEENSPVDTGFLSECCREWETAADQFNQLGIRTVKFRIGVVLSREGGALAEIIKPLRFGLGAYFGDGQSWWPWIHRDDVCKAFIWGLENRQMSGVFNLVAPAPARGKELVHATALAMRQPAVFLPAPAFVLRLIFGEMAAVILNSNRVSAQKLQQTGFDFTWGELDGALRDIFDPKN